MTNEVLDPGPGETPLYSRYFDGEHDFVEKHCRYKSLAMLNEVYLLLPDYKRVVVTRFLVYPISVVKADSCLNVLFVPPHVAANI